MSKFKEVIIPNNTKELLDVTEKTFRIQLLNIIPDYDENQIRIHSIIASQYVVQFSIQTLTVPNNQIQRKTFEKTKRNILNFTIHYLDLINDPGKILAKTAAELVFTQSIENVNSRILLLNQFTSLQEIDDARIIEFYPKMSAWLDKSIAECKSHIKKYKFPKYDKQMGIFSHNTNDASTEDVKTNLRNTTIKK